VAGDVYVALEAPAEGNAWVWLDELDVDLVSLVSAIAAAVRTPPSQCRELDVESRARQVARMPDKWPRLFSQRGEEVAARLGPGRSLSLSVSITWRATRPASHC
jgi:hypothetical protein